MTLGEYLETLDKTQNVSIGTNKGSGYLYIGSADNIIGISTAFASVYRAAKRELLKDNQLIHDGKVHTDYCVERIQRRITIRSEYVHNYSPALKRDIKEVYDRWSEDGIAIIIDGIEYGFWSADEFENNDRKTPVRYRV